MDCEKISTFVYGEGAILIAVERVKLRHIDIFTVQP
nr:MAG TPA: hypothetical protein [Caudoviricetes sp.]